MSSLKKITYKLIATGKKTLKIKKTKCYLLSEKSGSSIKQFVMQRIIIGLPLCPFIHTEFIKVELPDWLFWILFIASGLFIVATNI
jgi:hypothetical protein